MSDTHAATATDGQVTPAPEDNQSEQKSLDDILNEYKPAETPAVQSAEPQPNVKLDAAVSWIEQQQQKQETAEVETDLEAATRTVKGDDLELSDKVVNNHIYSEFSRDDRLMAIWRARKTNPGPFQEVLTAMGNDLRATKPVNTDLSENQAAMRAAVSGTTSAPEVKEDSPKAILDMNDSDFETWMEKNK